MRKLKRIAFVSLVCMLLIGVFAIIASAKTYTGTKYGYKSDYIYVKTGDFDNGTPTLKLNFYQGVLNTCESHYYGMYKGKSNYDTNRYGNLSCKKYASYELKIRYWNGSKYVMESNYDVYDKSTNTIKFLRENTDYQIQVYQWKVKTTLDSYINKKKFAGFNNKRHANDGPFWSELPKFATSTKKNCTELSKNPH